MNTLNNITKYLSDITQELLADPRPLSEAAWEHADSCENVIYPRKAHENVSNASIEELRDAGERLEETLDTDDLAKHGSVYDRVATLLSYYIEEARYTRTVLEDLEGLKSELEELRDATDADDVDEMFEAIETIEG